MFFIHVIINRQFKLKQRLDVSVQRTKMLKMCYGFFKLVSNLWTEQGTCCIAIQHIISELNIRKTPDSKDSNGSRIFLTLAVWIGCCCCCCQAYVNCADTENGGNWTVIGCNRLWAINRHIWQLNKRPTWCHYLLSFISLLLCSTCFGH